MKLGRAVRILRAARDIKQEALAGRLGTTSSYLSLIESGDKTPSLELIERLAGALGVSVPMLFVVAAEPADGVPDEIAAPILLAALRGEETP